MLFRSRGPKTSANGDPSCNVETLNRVIEIYPLLVGGIVIDILDGSTLFFLSALLKNASELLHRSINCESLSVIFSGPSLSPKIRVFL